MLVAVLATAQNLPVGKWRTHFSYQKLNQLLVEGSYVFCAAENGFFYLNHSTGEVRKLSKTDGLGDVGVTAMAYSEAKNLLVLGYASGIVDVIAEDQIQTIRGVAESSLVGNKRINDIAIRDGRIYLGTSFGVIVAQINGLELIENFRSIGKQGADVSVSELAIHEEVLYAITSEGLQYGNLSQNLLDFTRWTHVDQLPKVRELQSGACGVIAVASDTAVVQVGGSVSVLWESDQTIKRLSCDEQAVYALSGNDILVHQNGATSPYITIDELEVNDFAVIDQEVWLATSSSGLVTPQSEKVYPNGPLSDAIDALAFEGNQAYAFYHNNSGVYSVFDKSEWKVDEVTGLENITSLATFSGDLYFGAKVGGVYQQSSGELLAELPASVSELKVINGQLFGISSVDNAATLFGVDRNGGVTRYTSSDIGTDLPIAIHAVSNGVIWLTVSPVDGGGVIALDLEGDRFRKMTTSDRIASNNINDLVIDLSDDAWIATASGLSLMVDAGFVFNQSEAFSPIYESSNLFDNESVYALMVDGGNRIWMATDDGVWVFDNNLTRLDEHFTTKNSPLPSHKVQRMEYDPASGEVYILTDKGLVSYRSESSQGTAVHASTSVFPNPVLPGYDGLVGISGLVVGATVKVTTPNGKLVRSLNANGGTAAWDLADYNGRRVAAGIYVIWSASDDGAQTYVGKLAVID